MVRILCILFLLLGSQSVFAWGKRGHSIVCQVGAYLAKESKTNQPSHFVRYHSFDLGYYCNVPDLIWKRKATYGKEFRNHFLEIATYLKQLKKTSEEETLAPFQMSREQFAKKYKQLPESLGRSWWRVKELQDQLSIIHKKLKKGKLAKSQLHKLQEQWLTTLGVMGHYVGDLAMPLHVSKNYDGQFTGQKGLHHHFEETLVDELFLQSQFSLQQLVYKKALDMRKKYMQDNGDKPLLSILYALSLDSDAQVPGMLKIDKSIGRKSTEKAANAFKPMIIDRLARGALAYSLFIERNLGWKYNEDGFFNFNERPPFIEPGSKK